MANQILLLPGTALTFKDSGGDAVITLQNLAFGAGRISARYDRGAGAKPMWYKVRFIAQYNTAPQTSEFAEAYLYESDGTYVDGNVGTADAALTSAKLANGKIINMNEVDTTSTATNIISSGICLISDRYFSIGVWDRSSGDNFQNTANASLIILTPLSQEIQ